MEQEFLFFFFNLILTLLFIFHKLPYPTLQQVSIFNHFLDPLSHVLKKVNNITFSPFYQ